MELFLEKGRRRPRALFRLLIQFSLSFFLSLAAISLLSIPLFLSGGPGAAESGPQLFLVSSLGSLVATLLSLFLAARFLDRRRFREYGFSLDRGWFLDLGFGLALGALLMSGVFLTQLAFGWVSVTGAFYSGFDGVPFILGILPPLVVFLCVGIYEEAASRGYQLRNISEGLNYPSIGPRVSVLLAWVATSAVFGLLHLGNPNADLVSTLNISLAGLLLGAGYVLTGELAIPIGLHITWNFFQGSVFGFPVSGLASLGGSFLTVEQSGPETWTGGEFGPEAGLLLPFVIGLGTLATIFWVKLRHGQVGIATRIAEAPPV
ncbi:CPBP family intramembrane glutamic endopeptidase [Rubrobacter indicoceani]|uniref:CPBP family intramembrane glutamic endopeptidase n=1 Tax=Rubrobacter indicoceani TaxID=2051957 RepID=UPI000E5BCF5E|nr:type II CAAX endopeptidase family protein [Rubrobacter indicoceani]